jgi:hypothetical protein
MPNLDGNQLVSEVASLITYLVRESLGPVPPTPKMTNNHPVVSSLLSSRIFISNMGCRLTFPSRVVFNLESVDIQGVVPLGVTTSSAIDRVTAPFLLPECKVRVVGYCMKPSCDSFLKITVDDVSSCLIFVAVPDRSAPLSIGPAYQRPWMRLTRYNRASGPLSQRSRCVRNHGESAIHPAMALADDEGQECKKHEAVECDTTHDEREGRPVGVGCGEGVV